MSMHFSIPRAFPPRLRAYVTVFGDCRRAWRVAGVVSLSLASLAAQQVLDRVVARVGSTAITQTDVDAAIAFGVVARRAAGDDRDAVRELIDRRLMLAEVNRFPPAEPSDAAIMELAAKMRSQAGPDVAGVMKRTGADDKRLLELARDTLRIQAYITQRFGSGPQVDQQVARWIDDLRSRGDVTEVTPRR